LQSHSQNAINLFANMLCHQSYILQTTDSMMGTETDISDTTETIATKAALAAAARHSTGYLALVKSFVLVVPRCRGIKVGLKCNTYEYLPLGQ